jgi:hypothetical protein
MEMLSFLNNKLIYIIIYNLFRVINKLEIIICVKMMFVLPSDYDLVPYGLNC